MDNYEGVAQKAIQEREIPLLTSSTDGYIGDLYAAVERLEKRISTTLRREQTEDTSPPVSGRGTELGEILELQQSRLLSLRRYIDSLTDRVEL